MVRRITIRGSKIPEPKRNEVRVQILARPINPADEMNIRKTPHNQKSIIQTSNGALEYLQRLSTSPRHQEWVKIKQGRWEVSAFVVYPAVKGKVIAMVVIHENRGSTTGHFLRRI